MLPSRPNVNIRGAGFSPRSRSVGRQEVRNHQPDVMDMPTGPHHVPRQRSMVEPLLNKQKSLNRAPEGSKLSWSSSDSSNSFNSFSSRIRGNNGYASSRTSLEEDEAPRGRQNKVEAYPDHEIQEPSTNQTPNAGEGSAVWARVANIASTLTVNVSKAWASNATMQAGEDTPPGSESRLTRAMRAYHPEKARNSSDLPDWLFGEHERRSARVRPSAQQEEGEQAPSRGRPIRNLNNQQTVILRATSLSRSRTKRVGFEEVEGASFSKAADRLRAMRDAKRGALVPINNSGESEAATGAPPGQLRDTSNKSEVPERRKPVRMGLPAAPNARARRF